MFPLAAVFLILLTSTALAQTNRTELKRADLTGTQMEVILSTAEYKPGDMIPRHIHHGEEAFYVLEGATVEAITVSVAGLLVTLPAALLTTTENCAPLSELAVAGEV